MARKKSQTLTEAELKIMEVLWERGTASVKDVTNVLCRRRTVAYNTVLTMMKILKEKGYAAYEKKGRAFIYRPLINEHQARAGALKYMMHQFFRNSPSLLMSDLLEHQDIEPAEMRRMQDNLRDKVSCTI